MGDAEVTAVLASGIYALEADLQAHINDEDLHGGGAPLQHTHSASDITDGVMATDRLPSASVSRSGIVRLNNTLASDSTTEALTAAQGKALYDRVPIEYGRWTPRLDGLAKENGFPPVGYYRRVGNLVYVIYKHVNIGEQGRWLRVDTSRQLILRGLPYSPGDDALLSALIGVITPPTNYAGAFVEVSPYGNNSTGVSGGEGYSGFKYYTSSGGWGHMLSSNINETTLFWISGTYPIK